MKQLLTAMVLALIIHGLLLGMNFNWPGRIFLDRPKPQAFKMTLTSIPIQTTPEPSLQKPKPILRKPTIVRKKKQKSKPERVLKATPKKMVPIPVQSQKREVTKTIPEKTPEETDSHFDSEQTVSKTLLKVEKETGSTISPLQMIREAKPLYRSNPSPRYPEIARIRGYQGNVLLDVLVNKNGKVNDLKIYKSSDYPVLDRAAVSSVKHWLFEPGMIGENKVNMWVRVPIRFELR
ncbi:MAG: energy transducer TonB [Desulfobacterales bacterium]